MAGASGKILSFRPLNHWKMWFLGFIFNSYCLITSPKTHQFHKASCVKVSSNKEKLADVSSFSSPTPSRMNVVWSICWVRLSNPSNEILHLKISQGSFPFWPSSPLVNIRWTHTSLIGCCKIVVNTSHYNYRKQDFFIRTDANELVELKCYPWAAVKISSNLLKKVLKKFSWLN